MHLAAVLIEAFSLVLWLALPVLLVALGVAVVTSLLQGALRASDPSLGFVPKFFAVLGALWLSRDYLSERLLAFAAKMIHVMAQLGT